jgi:parallel beta-helix repeat protein
VVANNDATENGAEGIAVTGASNTAVASNTVTANCAAGIGVHGAPVGGSVQNNIVVASQPVTTSCGASAGDPVGIGVYDAAPGNTVVDYNIVHQQRAGHDPYAWGTPLASLAAFRAASGQGAHDIEADPELTGAAAGPGVPTSAAPAPTPRRSIRPMWTHPANRPPTVRVSPARTTRRYPTPVAASGSPTVARWS